LHGMWNAGRVVFWTVLVLCMILWISAIVMTDQVVKQGGQADPALYDYSASAWSLKPWTVHDYWGSVPRSFLSLFQVVTLDHWCSTLVRPLVARYPAFLILFIPFLMITVLSLLNVIVAVIVESTLASAAVNEEKTTRDRIKEDHKIMASLKQVFEDADTDGSGELDRKELSQACKHQHVRDRLKVVGLEYKDLVFLFDLLDEEKTGNINTNAFFRGVTRLQGEAMACDLHHMVVDLTRHANWIAELTEEHATSNDRLASLLIDVEGLDRDVMKGHHDEDDPVLMNRRHRFHRQMREQEQQKYDHDHHISHGPEPHRQVSSRSHRSSASYDLPGRSATHTTSLVGVTLHKTDIGIDTNEIRAKHGVARRPTLAEEYVQDLCIYEENQNVRKSSKSCDFKADPQIHKRRH